MRHMYTPVFREFTTSSMWAKDPATRCVWLYMMLHADPEGFIPGTIPGIAVASNVSLDDTRRAIAEFMAPDPDSNTQAYEGRRLEKVPHGWRILNFLYWRELAKTEADKARKRKWAHKKRSESDDATPDDVYTSTHVDASSETVDASKSKSKSGSSSSSSTAREPEPVEIRSLVLTELPADLELPEWLDAEARAAGVKDPKRWFDKLKEGPIGGDRGVLAHQLDTYLRRLVGSWRTWEETERAKDAQRQAAAASPRSFGARPPPTEPFEPNASQRAFARQHGLDLAALLKGVLDDHPQPSPTLPRLGVLGERLTVACKQKRAGHPVTGKLTREEAAAWGQVPAGGAIPEVA